MANLPKKAQVAAADLAPEIVDEDEAGKEWAVTIPNLPPGVGHRFEAPPLPQMRLLNCAKECIV